MNNNMLSLDMLEEKKRDNIGEGVGHLIKCFGTLLQ